MYNTIDLLLPKVKGKYRFDFPLGSTSWFGSGGKADTVFIPEDIEDLHNFITSYKGEHNFHVVGALSNILVPDANLRNVVIKLGRSFNYIHHDIRADGQCFLRVGGKTLDVDLAKYAAEHSIQGLEFFSGIPGTIGGAVAMNAGAYANCVNDIIKSVIAVHRHTGKLETFSKDELKLGYRSSPMAKDYIFVEAEFQSLIGDRSTILQKIQEIQVNRSAAQPIKSRTGGSTFANPEAEVQKINIANTASVEQDKVLPKAWELIDQAECRGLRIGSAMVSDLHCNFIISRSDIAGSPQVSQDIEDLILTVQQRVLNQSGIELRTEIVILKED